MVQTRSQAIGAQRVGPATGTAASRPVRTGNIRRVSAKNPASKKTTGTKGKEVSKSTKKASKKGKKAAVVEEEDDDVDVDKDAENLDNANAGLVNAKDGATFAGKPQRNAEALDTDAASPQGEGRHRYSI